MSEALVWLYVVNATLLLVHEIDAGYWREWRLVPFLERGRVAAGDDRSGHQEFLVLHVPLVALVLLGLTEVARGTSVGLGASAALAATGITAYCLHVWWERQGRREFSWPMSQAVLGAALLVSVAQLSLTVAMLGI